ncbi:uncharacterized protein LOC142972510 [Anticarsia gemmatalis]|uniref:uncharacterized protein LOC142972510 n=1 Tax=Anticarsia gemmatalis TaxID=129554 RepID=UPI003F76A5A7
MADHDKWVLGEFSNTQYFVSFDNLDMSLLGHLIEKPAEKRKLLWSRQDLDGESGYYYVTVSEGTEHEEHCYEPSETDICHICNIEVPKIYYRAHIKTEYHQIHKALAETFLENVSKQISVEIENPDVKRNDDIYYCEPCSKVIAVENRGRHNTSTYHSSSVERQKVAENFLKIYTGNINDDTENDSVNNHATESNGTNTVVHGTDSMYSTNSVSDLSENENGNKIIPYKAKKETTNTTLPATITHNNSDKVMPISGIVGNKGVDFILYLKKMIQKYKLTYKLPMIENDEIIVTTPKGHIEKVPIDTFQGLKEYKKYKESKHCQLCKKWVLKEDRSHIECETHVRNLLQPINDHFCRELTSNNLWSHCLLCNDLILTGAVHTIDPRHEKYYTPKTAAGSTSTKITPRTYCDACKIYIDSHNYSSHINSKKHKLKHNTVVPENKPAVQPQKEATVDTSSFCKLCQVHVPKGGMGVHERGKPHKNRLMSRINDVDSRPTTIEKTAKAIASAVKNLPSTSKANPAVPQKTKELTIDEKMAEYMKQMEYFSETELDCMVCEVKIPNYDLHVVEHVEGAKHRSAVEVLLSENKTIRLSTNMYYCETCKIQFDDFIDHFEENVDHIEAKLLSADKIDKDELIEYVHDWPENGSSLAFAYRRIYDQLLKKNRILKLSETSYYCGVCLINLTRISEIDHMFGERHKQSLLARDTNFT